MHIQLFIVGGYWMLESKVSMAGILRARRAAAALRACLCMFAGGCEDEGWSVGGKRQRGDRAFLRGFTTESNECGFLRAASVDSGFHRGAGDAAEVIM